MWSVIAPVVAGSDVPDVSGFELVSNRVLESMESEGGCESEVVGIQVSKSVSDSIGTAATVMASVETCSALGSAVFDSAVCVSIFTSIVSDATGIDPVSDSELRPDVLEAGSEFVVSGPVATVIGESSELEFTVSDSIEAVESEVSTEATLIEALLESPPTAGGLAMQSSVLS